MSYVCIRFTIEHSSSSTFVLKVELTVELSDLQRLPNGAVLRGMAYSNSGTWQTATIKEVRE